MLLRVEIFQWVYNAIWGTSTALSKIFYRIVCDRLARVGRNINEGVQNVDEVVLIAHTAVCNKIT